LFGCWCSRFLEVFRDDPDALAIIAGIISALVMMASLLYIKMPIARRHFFSFYFILFFILIATRVADRPYRLGRMQILLVVRIMDIDGFSFHHEDIKCRRIARRRERDRRCVLGF
jgi:hypothetical protein